MEVPSTHLSHQPQYFESNSQHNFVFFGSSFEYTALQTKRLVLLLEKISSLGTCLLICSFDNR